MLFELATNLSFRVDNKKGKVFSGLANIGKSSSEQFTGKARRRPETYEIAEEFGASLRQFGERSTKAFRNNNSEMYRTTGP